jgi:hypothetical protein
MNEKMMQMIEMMLTKHKAMKHGGKPGKYGKEAEDMEEGDMEEGDMEEGYGEEGEDETEVTIKFCGKDAMKKAHDLLMASYKK